MKSLLKSELKEWFGKIKEREEIINKSLKTSKLFYEIEDNNIEKAISKIAINLLVKEGWDFKKDRINGDQLSVEKDRLCLRQFRCHNSHNLYFLSDNNNPLINHFPESFSYGLQQIKDVIKQHNEKKEKFKKEREGYGYRRGHYNSYSESKVELISEKIKGVFHLVDDTNDKGIETKNHFEITLKSDIDGNAEISYGDSQLIYYDSVYNKVLEFIDKLKLMSKEAKDDYEKVTAQLNEMVEEDNFKMIMVVSEI